MDSLTNIAVSASWIVKHEKYGYHACSDIPVPPDDDAIKLGGMATSDPLLIPGTYKVEPSSAI